MIDRDSTGHQYSVLPLDTAAVCLVQASVSGWLHIHSAYLQNVENE